jgi:hypothetical protein
MIHISHRTYRLVRVFVAIALLVGANASLLQVVCEETGEALTTSTSAVMMGEGGTGAAPCGLHSEALHDRLCPDRESEHVCEEEGAWFDRNDRVARVCPDRSTSDSGSTLRSVSRATLRGRRASLAADFRLPCNLMWRLGDPSARSRSSSASDPVSASIMAAGSDARSAIGSASLPSVPFLSARRVCDRS